MVNWLESSPEVRGRRLGFEWLVSQGCYSDRLGSLDEEVSVGNAYIPYKIVTWKGTFQMGMSNGR